MGTFRSGETFIVVNAKRPVGDDVTEGLISLGENPFFTFHASDFLSYLLVLRWVGLNFVFPDNLSSFRFCLAERSGETLCFLQVRKQFKERSHLFCNGDITLGDV